jgi:hypothetical protein
MTVESVGQIGFPRKIKNSLTSVMKTTHLAKLTIVLLVSSCFGPYLNLFGYGIRTEQVVIYTLLLLLVPFFLRSLRLNLTGKLITLFLLLQFGISLLALFLVDRPNSFVFGKVLAESDMLLLPIATILVVAAVAHPLTLNSSLLVVASRTYLVLCSVNIFVALIQSRTSHESALADQSPLASFWTSDPSGWSVAWQAQLGSRYSGIFNQPAEAGWAYGMALVLLVFSCRFTFTWSVTFATLMAVGGLLSASKTFYACAVIVVIFGLTKAFWDKRIFKSLLAFTIVTSVSIGAIWTMGLLTDRMQRFEVVPSAVLTTPPTAIEVSEPTFIPAEVSGPTFLDVISNLTAGRIGSSSSQAAIVEEVASSPVIGFGLGGWSVAYDGSWTEALVISGWLGLALVFIVFLLLAIRAWVMWRYPPHSAFLLVLVSAAFVASLGIGALTANRVSTVFWIIVTLLALGQRGFALNLPVEKSRKPLIP